MSNLLDLASIVLTPTAYNNGEALCIKPDDGSGDFTFSRNSAATRVNAQGLVENVQILSSNLVQNGNFSEEGAEEVSNGSFSQEGVQLITNGNDTSNIVGLADNQNITIQTSFLTIGKTYKIDFEIYDYVEGSIFLLRPNDLGVGSAVSANGTYTYTVVADASTSLIFRTDGLSTTLKLRNISVREVGQDWIFTSGATLTDIGAKITHTPTAGSIAQLSVLTIGKQYKLTYEITESISGGLKFNSAVDASMVTTVGVHTKYFEADGTTAVIGRTSATDNDVTITNISVKEVLQNWSVEDYGAVSASAVITPNTEGVKLEKTVSADWRSSFLVQPISYTSGSQYKVTFRLKNGNLPSGGSVYVRRAYDSSSQSIVNNLALTNDWVEYTYYFVADSNSEDISFGEVNWQNAGVGQYFYVDDVSIIEITDDTNLPRINYEGFSYQDALGSEEIVNGDYEQSGIGNALSQSGGILVNENNQLKITSNGSSGFSRAVWNTNGLEGEQFLIKADIISVSGNTRFIDISNNQGQSLTQGTTFSTIITLGSAIKQVGFGGLSDTSFELVIDNVSVKEYLGQEVVPDSGCGSWLWEPQTTQLVPYSEDFSQYSTGSSPIVTGGFLAPDGTNNAYKITNSGSSTVYLTGLSLSSTATRSIYARSVSGTGTATLMSYFGNTNNVFTLTEQWQRFEVNGTTVVAGEDNFYAADFRGSGTLTEYLVWGANATNDQDYATSYIPSNGSQVTRNQDVCTNGGSLASINSTEGVLYAEIAALANDGTVRFLGLNDGSNNNRVVILYDSSANRIRAIVSSGGTKYVDVNYQLTNILDFHKVAVKYKANDFALWIDGVERATDTSGSAPIGLNDLEFDLNSGGPFFGKTKALAVFPYLSDSELQSLTTI